MPLRKQGRKAKTEVINVTIGGGGMGDVLSYLVVVNYIITEIPWIKPIIWLPDYLLDFAKKVLPKTAILKTFTQAANGEYNEKLAGVSTGWIGQHTPMRIHPIDFAAHVLIDGDLPVEKKNYLRFFPKEKYPGLPDNYIALSVGATNKTKTLPIKTMEQIIDHVISKGYTPVFLGKKHQDAGGDTGAIKANLADIDYTKGIDFTNKTSIVEAAAIISGAKAFIGMDGGLLHLAGFTDVPIVGGYSLVSNIMAPIRNNQVGYNCHFVLPDESLECRFCQTRTPLLYSADYFKCWYDDYKCLEQLTFSKWKEQIDKCLT